MTPSDYTGVDLAPVRELRRAHEATKVRGKDQNDGGTIQRGQGSLENEAAALERASKKLETAGKTVHQVEDLLHDTLTGFRTNRAEDRPVAANERLLRSADETANDIVGFARFDEEMVFPPASMPLKFDEQKALGAYARQERALKEQRSLSDHPLVADVLGRTNQRLRGDGGVLPTLSRLKEGGAHDPDRTDAALSVLKEDMGESRGEIASAREQVAADGGSRIDVAS